MFTDNPQCGKEGSRLLFVLSIMAVLAMATMIATAFDSDSDGATEFTEDGLKYEVVDESVPSVIVIGYAEDQSDGTLIIPATVSYQGIIYKIASVGQSAFRNCLTLTDLRLYANTYADAFYGCIYLNRIEISEGVTV